MLFLRHALLFHCHKLYAGEKKQIEQDKLHIYRVDGCIRTNVLYTYFKVYG